MSAFIDKSDYKPHIRQNRLDGIIELDDDILDKAEKRAIKVMKSHLNARYDVENIFNKTLDQRDEAILGYCLDITLMYLYRIGNPRKVPVYRKEAYDDAMIWLEGVKEGSIVPDDLPLKLNDKGENIKADFRFGSKKKRQNHIE
ncbi:phage protein Gp36 family protein [Tenacibaculum maritimum]|uniref:phage protein Gp36 family protein n=1 Tax=Tenacibaculum maritimum TaxID=107401 RepID=UPI0003F55708|nr:phage protein Gp36 family protein [Tenacibaculum maritimum]CAA0260231.1 conserved hypothetical protein [Tenacibaculum maritimum]